MAMMLKSTSKVSLPLVVSFEKTSQAEKRAERKNKLSIAEQRAETEGKATLMMECVEE